MKLGVKHGKKAIVITAVVAAAAAAVLLCVIFASERKDNTTLNKERVTLSGNPAKAPVSDELVIGVFSRSRDIHPYRTDDEASRYINRLVYPPLAQTDSEGGVKYINARSVTIYAGGKQADAVISEGVTFSDGTPLSPETVISSYEWFMEQETPYSVLLANVEKISAVGNDTVRFVFKKADAGVAEIFAMPLVRVSEGENATFAGTGVYRIESIMPDNDIVLLPNTSSPQKAEYRQVTIKTLDYGKLNDAISSHAADVFTVDKEEYLDLLKEDMSYSVFETQEQNGYYLLCTGNLSGLNGALARTAGGRDFFDNTQDFGAYPSGIVSAYMPEPNFRSLRKDGGFGEIKQLNVVCGYDPISQSIADELSDRLEEKGISLIKTNSDSPDASAGQDAAVYYGSWQQLADMDGFYVSHETEQLTDYFKDMEQFLSADGNIIPLQRNTRATAVSAGKNVDELIR